MIDVKKLITGFLILASIAGLSAIGLSAIGSSVGNQASNQNTLADSAAASPFGDNAFLASSAQTNIAASINYTSSSSDPNNLTQNVADAVLSGIISANPSGPQVDDSGTSTFVSPDTQNLSDQVLGSAAAQSVAIPDWDIEAAEQRLNIASDASSNSVALYNASLSSIFNKYFVSTDLQSKVSNPNNADPADLPYVKQQIEGALEEVIALQTPQQLAGFHKSLVAVLTYEKNAVALAQTSGGDPVKNSVIFSGEQTKFQVAADNFSKQLQAAQSSHLLSFDLGVPQKDSGIIASLRGIFGIQTAHAQWLVFDAANFTQMLWQWAQSILLQILKNTLITLIQNTVLKWVQGNGVPRFVQIWGTALVNSLQYSAIAAVTKEVQNAFPAFKPGLIHTVSPYYIQGGVSLTTPLKTTVGVNFQGFINGNFLNGGWGAFGASILPSGNFYGTNFFAAQKIDQTAATQQAATQAQHVAAQGTTGDMVCADGSNPLQGTHKICIANPAAGTGAVYLPINGACNPGDSSSQAPNAGRCADGSEPQKTTPGIVTSHGLNNALGSNIHLVVNANNIVSLALTVASSLLTNLVNKAITSAVNGGLTGTGTSAPPPAPVPPQPVTCTTPVPTITLPAGGTVMAYFNATGGTTSNGILPTYTWTANGGVLSPTTGISVNVTYATKGTFTATVTASTGGSSTCTVTVQ